MKKSELKQIVKECITDILNEHIVNEKIKHVDPTKDEMVSFLEKKCGADIVDDLFDIEAAIYWFASDYHGGQSSNLYSALSTSEFSPGPSHNGVESEGEFATTLYKCLVDEYFPEDKSPAGVPDKKIGELDESTSVKHVVKKPVKKPETNEWVVKWYVDGKYNEDKTYYTDDKSDADDTYTDMVDRAKKMNSGLEEAGIPRVKTWIVKTKDPKNNTIHKTKILAPTKRLAILNYRHEVGYDEIISVGLQRGENSDSIEESMPPGFPKPLYHKLKKKYKDSPKKAYATMWKIHKKYGDKLEETYNALDESICRIKGCRGKVVSPAETRDGLKGLCKKHVESQVEQEKRSGKHHDLIKWIHSTKENINEGFEIKATNEKDKSGRDIYVDKNGKKFVAVNIKELNQSTIFRLSKSDFIELNGDNYVIYSLDDNGLPKWPTMNVSIQK